MTTSRLEAFSDGVIAIIITIMVLALPQPNGAHWTDLNKVWPVLLSYALSFIYVGIYWNNHHHMLHMTRRVNGAILWANLHLLFWLSLVPFVTAWAGAHAHQTWPTFFYGAVLLLSAIAYFILQVAIIRDQGPDSKLKEAVGRDRKGKISLALYAAAIPLAFVDRWLSVAIYIGVAVLWLIPDRRIETKLRSADPAAPGE